jgi:hypothetical protein
MTKLKLLAACAALSTVVAATPSMADQVVHRHRAYHPGPVGAAADTAAGIAGAAIGTADAIATAPFRNSYNYDSPMGSAEYYNRHMSSAEFSCRPGIWIKGDDGRRHICQ